MRIAAAQLSPTAGDVEGNLLRHLALVDVAKVQGAELVCFPELSLTSYQSRFAAGWATTPEDPRLDTLQRAARALDIAIAVGVPLRSGAGVEIGMVIFQPRRPRIIYAKRLLHPDELPWFVPGKRQVVLELGGLRIVPAICYESLQDDHASLAATLDADVYLASVAKSVHGVERARAHYPAIAQRHGFAVVMANSVGPCEDFIAVGRSAAWDSSGRLCGCLGDHGEGLVVYDTDTAQALCVAVAGPQEAAPAA